MERSGISSSLHDRLLTAVDRAVQVQEESYALIEAQHEMIAELHETVAASERHRAAFGNGHRDAGARSPAG